MEETSICLTIPELIKSVSEKTTLPNEEVEKVVYAFIEYYLKKLKLK